MDIAVSPYHLTTREAPAMAALALARRVVTVVPGGDAGAPLAPDAARAVPAFGRFMKSWAWTVPLWEAGVITTQHEGHTLDADVWGVTQHIEREDSCTPLRHFVRRHEFDDQATYLRAVAHDLLKGGPDPGISLPVAAGLDRFAARRGVLVARGAALSLAQRAEASLAMPVFSIVVPVFLQADAERVLHYREVLGDHIGKLGSACDELLAAVGANGSKEHAPETGEVALAASALTHAYAASRDELLMGSADDDVRVVEGSVALSAVSLPWDAVLTSSVRALEHLSPAHPKNGVARHPTPHATAPAPRTARAVLPELYDGVTGKRCLSLVARPVGHTAR